MVQLLACSTGSQVWRLLDGKAGRVARAAHPTLAAVAAALSWHWLSVASEVAVHGRVRCMRRFAAAWPNAACAVYVTLAASADEANAAVVRALPPRVTCVTLRGRGVTDAVIAALPSSLHELDVSDCRNVTAAASFAHLPALVRLNCYATGVGDAALATVPASVCELIVGVCRGVTAAASFAHLPKLVKLHCAVTGVGDTSVATLPSCVRELNVSSCSNATAAVSFAHLPALLQLTCYATSVGDAALATLPPGCVRWT